MGIDYSGGMIIGSKRDEICPDGCDDDDFDECEWIDENDMRTMSLHYDAGSDDQYVGFEVPDIAVDKIDEKWIADIRDKAAKFEELTGAKAHLVGTQNIW